jgi:hypothetical protein
MREPGTPGPGPGPAQPCPCSWNGEESRAETNSTQTGFPTDRSLPVGPRVTGLWVDPEDPGRMDPAAARTGAGAETNPRIRHANCKLSGENRPCHASSPQGGKCPTEPAEIEV